MAITSLDNLQVFREALDAANAVSAILTRERFAQDQSLRMQLAAASAAVVAQIAEGYGQLTDRHFAHYLAMSRGSCNEVQAHLAVASGRGCLPEMQWRELSGRYTRLGKRLTRLIQ